MAKFTITVDIEVEEETEGKAITAVHELLKMVTHPTAISAHNIKAIKQSCILQDIPAMF